MRTRHIYPARPTCTACGRWLVPFDKFRNICHNCGEIQGDEVRAVGALCRTFTIDNPYVPTVGAPGVVG